MATLPHPAARIRQLLPPAVQRLLDDAFSRRLLAAAAVAIALAWSLLGFDVWRLHRERVAHTADRAASVARAVEQRVERTLTIADQVLLLTRERLLAMRGPGNAKAIAALLERQTPHFDEILTIAVVTPDGTSLALSNPAIAAGRNYAGSGFFAFHSSRDDDQLFVDQPIVGPASGQRVFTLSRAWRDDAGRLLAIVVAAVRTDILAEEFAAIRLGENGSLGFHHLPTYRVIARQPDYEGTFGRGLMHLGLQRALAASPQGIFEGAISADNEQRFFAYRRLASLPLAVTVGVARSDITDKLNKDLTGYLFVMVLLTLAIVGGSTVILRAHHREISLRRDLAEKDATFRAFFEAVPAGICTLDREMRYQLVNPALARINGKSLDVYPGRSVREVHPTLFDRLAPIHEELFRSGCTFNDILFSGPPAGQPGSVGHWQSTFFPIRDAAGGIMAMGCFVVEVSAQKNAEDAMRRSESLLASVLDLLPVGVWITDPRGRIVRTNPAGMRIWSGSGAAGPAPRVGYQGGGADSGEPLAADDWALRRAVRDGETTIGDLIEIECLDGSRRTVLNSAVPLHDAQGHLLGAVAVNEDVSEIRRAQEEMRITRDFFEQTFNAAPVGMAITGMDGRYIKVNRAMTELIGYPAEELLTKSYIDITHPDDLDMNSEMRQRLIAGENASHLLEKRYLRKDGSTVWALLVVSLVRDAAGRPLYTIGQSLDITRQKLAEQALRASAVRFRAIFDNASSGIVSTEEDGSVGYFNEAFRLMLGRDSDTLRRLRLADFTHPDDYARERCLLDEIRDNVRERYRIEKRYLRADGETIWVDSSVSAIRSADRRLSLVAVVYDVSERKEAELALSNSRHKLRALAAHQARLLEEDRKHVAREIHDELGQLLTALKMDISLLRLGAGDDSTLQAKVEDMRRLVDQTMNVVRHVASNLRPSALDLGLLPAIEWLADDFSARWEIPCTVDSESDDRGDAREIQLNDLMSTAVFRVVQESLTNIARHAGAGRVGIALRRKRGLLRVVVSDDGRGFDMQETSRKKGFGLFGMRERVLAVGGKLSIESHPGRGTTVTITLPIHGENTP